MTDPPRITTREVCALARYTSATLWRRIDAGHMPRPIDRGGEGFLFDRKAVLTALGMQVDDAKTETPNWDFDPVAYREAHARALRRRKGAGWRDKPRVLSGPGEAPASGLVSGDPATDER
jgi:predicted DNA-binding transcriptional regulator AlpA